jgi:hypothetical protein
VTSGRAYSRRSGSIGEGSFGQNTSLIAAEGRAKNEQADCAKTLAFLNYDPCNFSWFQKYSRDAKLILPGSQGVSVSAILSDLLLFSCIAAFYTGIVLAIASLLS